MSWLSFLQPLCDRAKIDKLLFKKYRNLSPAKKNVLLVLKTKKFSPCGQVYSSHSFHSCDRLLILVGKT